MTVFHTQNLERETVPLEEFRYLVGSPARITISDSRTPDGTVKIPGTIRDCTETGLIMELFFPMVTPRTGQTVVLEVMTRNALLQCYSRIEHSPSPQFLQLGAPDGFHPIQRRRFPRVSVVVSTNISCDAVPVLQAATVVNLSAGGCALVLGERLPVGALVNLDLASIGLEPSRVWAHVVRSALTTSPHGRYELGLSFVNLSGKQRDGLAEYVQRYM